MFSETAWNKVAIFQVKFSKIGIWASVEAPEPHHDVTYCMRIYKSLSCLFPRLKLEVGSTNSSLRSFLQITSPAKVKDTFPPNEKRSNPTTYF